MRKFITIFVILLILVTQIVLLSLKANNVINCSWLVVFIPSICVVGFIAFMFLILFITAMVLEDSNWDDWEE